YELNKVADGRAFVSVVVIELIVVYIEIGHQFSPLAFSILSNSFKTCRNKGIKSLQVSSRARFFVPVASIS
ncbi:MAG: hypothetical protein V3V95_00210, partial [Thermodesulfobacteriota bacterium]